MLLILNPKREDRGGGQGRLGQTLPPWFAKVSPAGQTQVAAHTRLADGPRMIVAIGGDDKAKIAFPVDGGQIALPLNAATRDFYNTDGFRKASAKMRELEIQIGINPMTGQRKFPQGSLYGETLRDGKWSAEWFMADRGVPVFKFEITPTVAPGERAKIERWVVAVRPEDPDKTGRQALVWILRRHERDIFERLWDFLTSIPALIVDGMEAFLDALKDLVCGPAKPFIDDLIVLATPGGAQILGAERLAKLASATGKSEKELTALATEAKGTVVQGLTNTIVERICGAALPMPQPLPESSVVDPAGSVAVFDANVGQYRILAPPL